MFDFDSDGDNATKGDPMYQQTADWTGFDTRMVMVSPALKFWPKPDGCHQ
jgi:hypothetical protein